MSKNKKGIGLFHMLRDVLVASINKGQFPMAILGVIAAEIIWKLPPKDVSHLVFRLLDVAEARFYAGYVLAVIITFAWLFHSRYQRRTMTNEITRISDQRNQLQENQLGKQIRSSEERR